MIASGEATSAGRAVGVTAVVWAHAAAGAASSIAVSTTPFDILCVRTTVASSRRPHVARESDRRTITRRHDEAVVCCAPIRRRIKTPMWVGLAETYGITDAAVALSRGTRLGPYEIVALLGAGG